MQRQGGGRAQVDERPPTASVTKHKEKNGQCFCRPPFVCPRFVFLGGISFLFCLRSSFFIHSIRHFVRFVQWITRALDRAQAPLQKDPPAHHPTSITPHPSISVASLGRHRPPTTIETDTRSRVHPTLSVEAAGGSALFPISSLVHAHAKTRKWYNYSISTLYISLSLSV